MDSIVDGISIFLTSGLGILLQVITFIAILIPGIKWMNQQLDKRIDGQIDDKLNPVVKDICNQLSDAKTAMKVYKEGTDTAIKYLDKAIAGLQGISNDREINRYIRENKDSE